MGRNGYLQRREEHIQAVTHKLTKDSTKITLWLAIVELNEEFGYGAKRGLRFLYGLQKKTAEYNAACREDPELAKERLRRRVSKILKREVT